MTAEMDHMLLRVYLDPDEVDQITGYPWAWISGENNRPRIPDYVRGEAGHRCVRCLHPFVVGETPGEWSPCNDRCRHDGPLRMREIGSEGSWQHHPLPGIPALESTLDEGPNGPVVRWEVEAQWRILTVHHLTGVKHDCRWWNLVPLCQRCHLTIQAKVKMERPWTREHSDWFKPYAAGYYAWSIRGEELGRAETAARQDELLALAQQADPMFPDVARRY